MKRKILLILVILILCAGCDVKYKITINEDGSVDEYASLTEDSTFFEQYPKSSIGRVVGFLLEPHLDELNDKEYEVKNVITNETGGAVITKKYDDIEQYVNNNLFYSQFTNKINYSKDGAIVTLIAEGAFEKDAQVPELFNVDTAEIIIEVPYKVTENNADEVNGNVYKWIFKKSDKEIREIKLVYNSKIKVNAGNIYMYYIAIGVIVIALIAMLIFYYKFNKKKKTVNEI